MTTVVISEKLKALAKDLNKEFPRSPREKLAGYVIAARMVDRCRALLNGTLGPYKYNGGMDQVFFEFTGLDSEETKAFIATGTSDAEIAEWIKQNAKTHTEVEKIQWNNTVRAMTIRDLNEDRQLFMEDYIPQHVPAGKIPRVWFDVYDMEEGRL